MRFKVNDRVKTRAADPDLDLREGHRGVVKKVNRITETYEVLFAGHKENIIVTDDDLDAD